jgi:hypothetical protein
MALLLLPVGSVAPVMPSIRGQTRYFAAMELDVTS